MDTGGRCQESPAAEFRSISRVSMLKIVDSEATRDATTHALCESNSIIEKKAVINHVLQLLKWLLDARPAITGWKLTAPKLAEGDEWLERQVVKMIDRSYWRKQLGGWKEVAAAMVACYAMTSKTELYDLSEFIVSRCKYENDDLHQRMHAREVRSAELMDEEPPLLHTVHRRDVSSEAKWTAIHSFLTSNTFEALLKTTLLDLEECVHSLTPPTTVVDKLKNIPKPPGYKTLEQRQEEERMVRARELAEDEDF